MILILWESVKTLCGIEISCASEKLVIDLEWPYLYVCLGLRQVNMSLCIGLDLIVYGLCLDLKCVYHGIYIGCISLVMRVKHHIS